MPRLAVLLAVGAVHGGLLVALAAALEARAGLGVALLVSCVALVATTPARRRVERRLVPGPAPLPAAPPAPAGHRNGTGAAERRRLSRDLHDRVGPAIVAFKLTLAARRRAAAPVEPPLTGTELAAQAAAAAAEVRRVLEELGPAGVEHRGLVGAVEEMAGRLSAGKGPVVVVRSPADLGRLSPEVEHTAYAVAVEALSNAVRHALARTCTIRFEEAEALRLIVEDDGVGLPAEPSRGIGLDSMRRRAAEVGGSLAIERLPRGGTRVIATLPRTTEGRPA